MYLLLWLFPGNLDTINKEPLLNKTLSKTRFYCEDVISEKLYRIYKPTQCCNRYSSVAPSILLLPVWFYIVMAHRHAEQSTSIRYLWQISFLLKWAQKHDSISSGSVSAFRNDFHVRALIYMWYQPGRTSCTVACQNCPQTSYLINLSVVHTVECTVWSQ